MVVLRTLSRDDVAPLLAIQHARAGTTGRRSHAALELELFDSARGLGAHVDVAVEDGVVRGAAGRVSGGDKGFLAPVIAATDEAAAALVAAGVAALRAAGAHVIRGSTGELDGPVARAYAAAGFTPKFEFIDLARPTAWVDHALGPGLDIRPLDAVDPGAVRAVHDLATVDTPNSLPLSPDALAEAISGPRAFAAGAGAVVGPVGAVLAMLIAGRDHDDRGDHATVEIVAVHPERRGAGLARALVARLITVAHAAGIPEVRALIASTNVASLALHRRLAFTDLYRRTVYELDAAPAPPRATIT